jgi:hypothetical protein
MKKPLDVLAGERVLTEKQALELGLAPGSDMQY